MKNADTSFYGIQEGEHILYVVRPHRMALMVSLLKVFLAGLAVWVGFVIINTQVDFLNFNFGVIGFLLALVVVVVGWLAVNSVYSKRVGYITDRRVVKFEAPNFLETRSRSLNWQDAVKAKTYPPNFLWRLFDLGTVSVHAHSTMATVDDAKTKNVISDDDIDLTDVYYYQDLGNYIDKILFTYKREPEKLTDLKPFVTKPSGQRD